MDKKARQSILIGKLDNDPDQADLWSDLGDITERGEKVSAGATRI